ncbi:MAG: ABC transporter permease, partial [Ruminococcus sp.]|nr:ABC transporter permease [Ruminococcus sp.]
MRDPLNRRVFREIKGEAGKYTVIFIFMVALIGVASGYFISDESLKVAYDESFEVYNIEDGYLEFAVEPDDAMIEACEEEDLTLYKNYYKDEPCDNGSTVRLFKIREEVNKVCLLEGSLPESEDEIGLDRLHMKSNDLEIGDTVVLDGHGYKITGTIALPDYSALYQSVTDFMFDTEKFGVSVVTPEGFDKVNDDNLHYSYSWKYDDPPEETFGKEAKDRGDDLMKALAAKVPLANFVPTCRNSAIKFAGNDLGHDRIMMVVMLDMLIVIISFVFAVTTSNTITKEANVIGTLRASGYTRLEMIRHYLAAPVIVLLIACVIGNILGYTVFKEFMADMYLGSYSLVSYKTLWNANAFIDTTVIPMVILIAINVIMLASKLSLSPLKFIRRDLKRRRRKKAFKLNTKIPIMTRYRLRVLFQNAAGYLTIFVGIFFASTIMVFSQLFSPLLEKFSEDSINSMIAQHTYILKAPAPTEDEDAEKFAAGGLKIVRGDFSEDVSIYGISPDSSYFHSDIEDGKVEISSAYADKYRLKAGDSITLSDEYGGEEYTFDISGIYDYPSTLVVFMDIDFFNETFDH